MIWHETSREGHLRLALLIAAGVFVLTCSSCNQSHAPTRPAGVPNSAVWVGGPDGGAFIDCAASRNEGPNACTVYDEPTGEVWMSGGFALEGWQLGVPAQQLKYAGVEGSNIYLVDGSVLVPVPPSRPTPIQQTAHLAENGVYVDCQAENANTYQCQQFLAADGTRIADTTYKVSNGEVSGNLKPTIATRSCIELENGAALQAM